jgi:hypothetical protein
MRRWWGGDKFQGCKKGDIKGKCEKYANQVYAVEKQLQMKYHT